MKKKRGSVGTFVASTLGTAALITVLIDGGWMVWVPVLLALCVLQGVRQALDH